MDEISAVLKARKLVMEADIDGVPVILEKYLKAAQVNAVLRVECDIPDDEAGSSAVISGQRVIFVNGRHSRERQRFTVLHEIGHIFLGLSSSHEVQIRTSDLLSYQKRSVEEVICDVFAAELLLPEPLFRKDVADAEINFNSIERLAFKYQASITSTGSRFALLNEEPCAFVLSEAGRVRYVSYSPSMKRRKGWISLGLPIPHASLTARRLKKGGDQGPIEIEACNWLENGNGESLMEDVRFLERWNQALTLLWFENGTNEEAEKFPDGKNTMLAELDGNLPWPSKSRRR